MHIQRTINLLSQLLLNTKQSECKTLLTCGFLIDQPCTLSVMTWLICTFSPPYPFFYTFISHLLYLQVYYELTKWPATCCIASSVGESPRGGSCSIHDGEVRCIFLGWKFTPLSIFLGLERDLSRIFLLCRFVVTGHLNCLVWVIWVFFT